MTINEFFELLCLQLNIARFTKKNKFIIEENRLEPQLVMILHDLRSSCEAIKEARLAVHYQDETISLEEIDYIQHSVEFLLNERGREALSEKDHHDRHGPMHFEQVEEALRIWHPNFMYVCYEWCIGVNHRSK